MTMASVLTADSPFDVINVGESRPDPAARREIKFAIDGFDVVKLRRLLEVNCRRLIHQNAISVVRSIYFDDASLSACHANLDGHGRRRKLRLRWYDAVTPEDTFFVEVKWRAGRVTGKHRIECRSDVPLVNRSYRQIRRGLEASMPTHLLPDVLRNPEPVVIVEYNREHFVTDDGLRITLDYDLTYYDQAGCHAMTIQFPRRLERLVVLEGKTPIGREGELQRWLHPLSLRPTRCSKYVLGCQQIGRISASEL